MGANEISWSLVLNEMDHGFYSWMLVCGLCGSLLSVFVFFSKNTCDEFMYFIFKLQNLY